MAKVRFHKLAAIGVLIGFAAWMGTGEFSSVGSAAAEAEKKPTAAEQPKAPTRTVAVITPPRVQHARAIRMSGQTEADKRAVLATRVGGIIAKLPVKQGQHVKAGDLVLMLDAEEKTAAVETARQLVAQRQAEADAQERLVKSGNSPKLQSDIVRSALAAARSQLEAAQAELARTEVKAPFDGVIDRVPVELGSSIMAGGEVATILSLDPIVGKGEISERDLSYVKIGDDAEVKLVNGDTAKGTVRYISRDASTSTRTFRIEIAVPNPEGSIPAGMTAEITVSAQPAEAVILPRSVVTLSSNGDLGIRAVDKDQKVSFHPIDLVDDTPSGLVLGGIPSDARIIVAGQDLVSEGDTVDAVDADAEMIKKLAGAPSGGLPQ
ncbi:efflux RND transporter periplasmic adaptor subunit [Pseudaminobacter soli (ex Li et al. 2025)]|uniref:Efflux transporter periplasmic adaptor subunit n=1 Tax=Pseudaminobacter soli (ex Li et al. 2025) TaxID=1295366 RepID=A0A2P7SAH2_9HYPH|nr:efflux RND transporter periplasmic adaptor subunit [Mesorhizobium soli]PSJ59467.1 efflux transporter periplasmic adaptor subunit [Mesorhizobium soli]